MKKIKTIVSTVAAAVVLGASNVYAGPVSYTGGSYTENFDAFPWYSGHNRNTWVDDLWVPGWYASGVTALFAGQGQYISETAEKSIFVFGTDDDDNALGSQLGDPYQPWVLPVRFGVRIVNDTGQALTDFTLSYVGEIWRQGADRNLEQLTFHYAVGVSSLESDDYLAEPALNYATTKLGPLIEGRGNYSQYKSFISYTVTGLDWQPGQSLWLRWTDVDDPGRYANSALAIDDLEFRATRVIPTAPVIIESTSTQPAAVPEPNTAALAALSFLALGILIRRTKQKA